MKCIILSDIHGNCTALNVIIINVAAYQNIDTSILLGDLIDYGQHSNEVVQAVKEFPYPILCSLRGNHEDAILRDTYARFSSDRGRQSARYTRNTLNAASWDYLSNEMESCGQKEFEIDGKKCLAIHGSLADEYWGTIRLEDDLSAYSAYDYVFSGHSHVPHFFEKYYPCEDAVHRNKKKTIFINPGSVGQPRNLNPMAQFVLLDTETEQITFEKVAYDIEREQSYYHGQIDDFYRERLKWGI